MKIIMLGLHLDIKNNQQPNENIINYNCNHSIVREYSI